MVAVNDLAQFLKPVWKTPACFSRLELTPRIARWLLYPGSFTEKGATLQPGKIMQIQILREGSEMAATTSYEYSCFNSQYIYFREIKIFLDNEVLMFARSAVSTKASAIFRRRFRRLGHQPLGHILFASKEIQRGAFELAKILPSYREYNWAITNSEVKEPFLWGRRSLFSHNVKLLLLTEIFSPALIRLIDSYEKNSSIL